MRARKKPVEVEVHQWFKNGDHPEDHTTIISIVGEEPFESEGKVVRYFRHPDEEWAGWKIHTNTKTSDVCERTFHDHGWIDTAEGGHTVCPGDYIITGVQGEYYPCKPSIFDETYEVVG